MKKNFQKIKVGILFGGPSKEREISFAGGRTVYDNLDKTIYDPLPIFITADKELVLLDWQYIYKGSIRDFYPPQEFLSADALFRVYDESLEDLDTEMRKQMRQAIGEPIAWSALSERIDFAFLCLHGEWGEDGQLQGLLESEGIPYSGSGIRSCAIGIDKVFQKRLLEHSRFLTPKVMILDREKMPLQDWPTFYEEVRDRVGFPLVVRPSRQGSSLGVSILGEETSWQELKQACESGFFTRLVTAEEWQAKTEKEKIEWIQNLVDFRNGIGLPVRIGQDIIRRPEELLRVLDATDTDLKLHNINSESQLILEEFIDGTEFSGVVLRTSDGRAVCLPPTEILKKEELFDYRSKYLPGMSRKRTPIDLDGETVRRIQAECEALFDYLGFEVYARIDGFIKGNGEIYLNDPNTTSGMLPSSFFFHQAAEIGLNPSQFITYLIQKSLQARKATFTDRWRLDNMIDTIDQALSRKRKASSKTVVGVIFGGVSAERHISVESGRNIYEKLFSSEKYLPIPIFLTGSLQNFKLYQLPIRLLLKDNADDIAYAIQKSEQNEVSVECRSDFENEIEKYLAGSPAIYEAREIPFDELPTMIDFAFIALHGRPGEDGEIQKKLEALNLPYNGSGVQSSKITINKHRTLSLLRQHGFPTASQVVLQKAEYIDNTHDSLDDVEDQLSYPLIAKPLDDGCSAAVKLIKDRTGLEAYLQMIFRDQEPFPPQAAEKLGVLPSEEFPPKEQVLLEQLISVGAAAQFMEITVGVLTQILDGQKKIKVLPASEVLLAGDILSLEEKFLAGEGQNITPARVGIPTVSSESIFKFIDQELSKLAEILDIDGYARIDAFLRIYETGDMELLVIEVNSLPGMTPATCIFHQAALEGYTPYEFIEAIIEAGQWSRKIKEN